MPGNYPEESVQCSEHGKRLKSGITEIVLHAPALEVAIVT